MGWVESPEFFCAITELVQDLTQHFVDNDVPLPEDPVETLMKIMQVPLQGRTDTLTKLLQVYVNDFCHTATQSTDGTHIPTIRQAAIHGIHALFPPPLVSNHSGSKEPISWKKLAQGKGNFDTTKEMIGFLFEGVKRTVRLPAKKALAYIKEMHTVLCRKTIPLKSLHAIVGRLHHASVILPAAKGFFTPINTALQGNPKIVGLGASLELRAALEDLISLLCLLSSCLTHVFELVLDMPHYVGYHDAAAKGAGGVWFSLADHMSLLLWREVFPSDIAASVISDTNPAGSITRSDLELAAEVMAIGVILITAPHIKHAPLGTLCNNTPTVSWVEIMASRAKTPTAGRLLRGLAFMLHCSHAGRLTTAHVPGTENVMADIASRPAKAQKLFHLPSPLTDSKFCSAFDTTYPLPDNQLWTLAATPPWVKYNVFKMLHGKQSALRQWTGPSVIATGKRGRPTVLSTTTPPTAHKHQNPSQTSSSCLLLPCRKESTASKQLSRFSQLKGLSGTLPKSSFWTDIPTPGRPRLPSSSLTSPSLGC
jgi:hypothetical protein